MASTPQELIYDEVRSAIALQAHNLDELRSRTGTLLAVAALSASFLGRTVLEDEGSGWLELGGGVCLAAVGALAVAVLIPWSPRPTFPWTRPKLTIDGHDDGPGWVFVVDTRELAAKVDEHTKPEELAKLHLTTAEELEVDYDNNQAALNRLYKRFRAGCILLVGGVTLWLLELALSS